MASVTILRILNPESPEQEHFNSLSLSAFVCTWENLAVKPIAPKFRGVQHLRPSGTTTRKGLMKFLIKTTFDFKKCRLQCELLFNERL